MVVNRFLDQFQNHTTDKEQWVNMSLDGKNQREVLHLKNLKFLNAMSKNSMFNFLGGSRVILKGDGKIKNYKLHFAFKCLGFFLYLYVSKLHPKNEEVTVTAQDTVFSSRELCSIQLHLFHMSNKASGQKFLKMCVGKNEWLRQTFWILILNL